ncbi:MAG: extracellular solute-binding protein, partial [Thermomicrobiales bacterium]|nr:extracellular solute-binding protein [Thermomicrobiales bacterium]
LEQLQASGTTPLTVDATGLVWQTWAYWTSQQIGGAVGVNELVTGKRKFASPEYIAASAGWAKMQSFAVPGAETMSGAEAYQMLFTGQAAMTTAGSWIIGDAFTALGDQLGMIKYPDFIESAPITHGGIGGAGNAFIVSNYSQHKDETVAFIKFLMSKEEQKMKVASGEGALSNVTDVDFATIFTDPFKITQQAWANEPSTIFWNDNVYPAELTTEIAAQAQLAWTGQISAEEFMSRIDAKRDELLEG